MTPAFGFSVGDFMSAITDVDSILDLIKKVSKALKQSGGAVTEYQHVVIELRALKNVLRHLEALEPTEDNLTHVNAIRGMALACQLPLREFLIKLEKYESALGPLNGPWSFRGVGSKTKWAIALSEDVEKLRALIGAKVISINLLLATHASQALSSIESRARQEHATLMTKIVEHRAGLDQLGGRIQQVENRASEAESASISRLDSLSLKADRIQSSLFNLRSFGEQVLQVFAKFPNDVQGLLQKIMCTNMQIYHLLVQVQHSISTSPSVSLELNIRFEDALGRVKILPYDYFRYWEPFEGFLRADFRDFPGENKIAEGHYHILDAKRCGTVVKKQDWTRSIFPGASLFMSMILSHLQAQAGTCPRPSCIGKKFNVDDQSNSLTCSKCGLKCFTRFSDLEASFDRVTVIEEEEQVAQMQVEEDLQLYGRRLKPLDTQEAYDVVQLNASQSRKRNVAESRVDSFERPRKIRKEDLERYEDSRGGTQTGNITAIDWNSGASPLDAWLNQSALPSAAPSPDLYLQHNESPSKDVSMQETKDVAFFRNVHISAVSAPKSHGAELKNLEESKDLTIDAQFYYRKIKDRYPLLPIYLARRLAIANHNRAKRLRSHWEERYKIGSPAYRFMRNYSFTSPNSETVSSMRIQQEAELQLMPPPNTHSQSDFWTGGSQSYRPPSTRSRSSSMNSSLHGSSQFDPGEQNPEFFCKVVGSSSVSISNVHTGLPAPPVKLGKQLTFECDICGNMVKVKKRREWQRHVLGDLQPYVCTSHDCDQAEMTYSTSKAYVNHLRAKHRVSQKGESFKRLVRPVDCLFCGERLELSKKDATHLHVRRHMEEIAFTVVTKPYEDWEFYSNSSASSDVPSGWCGYPGCGEYFAHQDEMKNHQMEVHELVVLVGFSRNYRFKCKAIHGTDGKPCDFEFGSLDTFSFHKRLKA